jgi:hypothetical protein
MLSIGCLRVSPGRVIGLLVKRRCIHILDRRHCGQRSPFGNGTLAILLSVRCDGHHRKALFIGTISGADWEQDVEGKGDRALTVNVVAPACPARGLYRTLPPPNISPPAAFWRVVAARNQRRRFQGHCSQERQSG